MTEERLKEILEDDHTDWVGDNAFKGLQIISKYFGPEETILCGASHDQIYSVGLDKICKAGITEEDAKSLRLLNWMDDDDCLACFV